MTAQTLASLPTGSRGLIRRLLGGREFSQRLAGLGLTVGAVVDMLHNYGRGSLIISVRDTRIALGRGQAAKVMVDREGAS